MDAFGTGRRKGVRGVYDGEDGVVVCRGKKEAGKPVSRGEEGGDAGDKFRRKTGLGGRGHCGVDEGGAESQYSEVSVEQTR